MAENELRAQFLGLNSMQALKYTNRARVGHVQNAFPHPQLTSHHSSGDYFYEHSFQCGGCNLYAGFSSGISFI